jgi:hypothetical protein
VTDLLRRVKRDTLIVWLALTAALLVWRPRQPQLALGVVGGGVLVGLAYWAIRGVVDGVVDRGISREKRSNLPGFALVKFFTRHAILAVAGYGMMARLELHPVGMLIGVAAPAVAAALEATRTMRNVRRP